MNRYHVSGGYRTKNGGRGTFAHFVTAPDIEAARLSAERTVRSMKRYGGKMDMTISLVEPEEKE